MSATHENSLIGRYVYIRYGDPTDAFRSYDPRCPEVAVRVAGLIQERMPDARVEHTGSTAVPGCAGKGVVDLMLLYPQSRLAAARDALDGLGFQRQTSRDPFPEERPMRVGTLLHDGETFRLHVHVIAADAPEAAEQLRFRDRLRADPTLMAEYVARKRAVLASGIADNIDYNRGKESFIKSVLNGAATLAPNG